MKKKIIFFFVFVLMFHTSSSIFAQLLEENFEYTAGTPITDYNWTSNGNPGPNSILVVAPGLEFPCYAGSGLGNAVALNPGGPDAFKFLSRKVNTASAYVSFMVKFSHARTGDYFFHLSDSTTSFNNDIGRVYARDSAGKIAFGLGKESNQNSEVEWSPAIYNVGITYVVIIKYTFVTGSQNDLVSLFVFDDCPPTVEPTPTLGPNGAGQNDLSEVGKVVLRQGSSSKAPNLIIDGIYAGTTFSEGALPVELSAFTSTVSNRDATLSWTTVSENNNAGFNIERKLNNSAEWITVGNVAGAGTSSIQKNYSFTDRNLNSGRYNYRLKQIDYNGNFEFHNLNSEIEIGTPSKFDLSQNYPNPFNPSTKINYDLSFGGLVNLNVFDMSGKEILSIVNEQQAPGYYSVSINAGNIASGVYYYRLTAIGEGKNFVATKKMILVK